MTPEEKIDHYVMIAVRLLAVAGSLIAILILTDFFLPGKVVIEKVEWRVAETSSSHRNRHFAYRLSTANRSFYTDKKFFAFIDTTDTVQLELSAIFSAVNTYACQRYKPEASTFSFRYASGVFLPLGMLLMALLSLKIRLKAINFFVFVLAVLNFIALIMLLK
jgi:hypothetical protein